MAQKLDGTYTFSQVDSGYRLAIQDGNLVDGSILTALKRSGSFGQFFSVVAVGNNTYSFVSEMSSKCVDLLNGDCSSGAKIQQITCDITSLSQLWLVELPISFTEVPVNGTGKILPTPVPGDVNSTQIVDNKTGLCVTYMGNNTQFIGATCSSCSTAQQFTIRYNHDLTYSIYHVATKQYLDLPIGGSTNGTMIWSNPRSNSTYQKFFISIASVNTWTIKNTNSGFCMDMDCRSFKIDQWQCQSTSQSQQWNIVPYTIATPAC